MSTNATPEICALHNTQDAINWLRDIYHKDTEIISAIRDLENAKSRILDALRRDA